MAQISAASGHESFARVQSDFLESIHEEHEEKSVCCPRFRQQEMWAIRPVWSPMCVAAMYAIVAAVFIPIGVTVLINSLHLMQTTRVRYDNQNQCVIPRTGASVNCLIPIDVTKNVTAPTYFYYGLVNFFQNARTYVPNLSYQQLRGQANPDTSSCKSAGAAINNAVPCGLVANSFFNDTFDLCRDPDCNSTVSWRKEGIAWSIDVNKNFRPGPVGTSGYTNASNSLVTDQDFMVWMRLATYSNFHKLYRIIEEDLPAQKYFVRVNASYPVSSFGGQKFFFIAKTSWFGGRSEFLGIAYLVVGGFALIMALIFAVNAGRVPEADLLPETTVPLEGYIQNSGANGATSNDK